MMKIEFVKATIDDVDKLIDVQNQSFYNDFLKYGQCPNAIAWTLETPADK